MANTYTQIHVQVVFAVQNRQSLISTKWKSQLYKYMTGIIQNYGHKVLQINGMPDHIHILTGMRPTQSLPELMKQVKQDSSKWITKQDFVRGKFSWQAGYGAFSYAKSEVPAVINYIQRQEERHSTRTFKEEYLHLLKEFEIDYNEDYLFKGIE